MKVVLSSLNQNLKVLKLDQEISVEDFKYFKNLQLSELKVKVVETSKRSII